MFTVLANALERVPADLELASAILGGRGGHTLRRITLPLVLPAILAGTLVAFLQGLTMFGTPAILAMPAGFHTLTTRIWSLFQYPPRLHLAAAASLPLLLVTLLVLFLQRRLLARRSFVVVGGKNSPARVIALGRWRMPALVSACWSCPPRSSCRISRSSRRRSYATCPTRSRSRRSPSTTSGSRSGSSPTPVAL